MIVITPPSYPSLKGREDCNLLSLDGRGKGEGENLLYSPLSAA
jgi:hypothetical protein